MNAESPGPVTPRLYLLDIEGTVAPVSFVTEELFPYARDHFAELLRSRGDDPGVHADLELLAAENRAEIEHGHPQMESVEHQQGWASALNYLLWLMDRDRKSTALKSLQGKIWKTGFEAGRLRSRFFADVPGALHRWAEKARVAIYSSGSVEAQQLLFRHSSYGDLTPLISAYFDTRTGPKTAPASYKAIAAATGVEPAEILFFSDAIRELDAAVEAGCHARLVFRESSHLQPGTHGHILVTTFEGL
jgi:enolase-phosphatase E1